MPLLFQASGSKWKIEVIGKRPPLPSFIDSSPQSHVDAVGVDVMERLDLRSNQMKPLASGESIEPLFFEAVAYDIHFEKSDPSATLTLPPGAELRRHSENAEHYHLNFGNNVGFADISIATSNGLAKLRIEVFSRKVDYKTDYALMRDEVSAMLRNLAMAATAKTYGLTAPAEDKYPTLIEWFALLQVHFDEFISLTSNIARHPHSRLTRKLVSVTTDRARRVSRRTIARALRSRTNGPIIPDLGVTLPKRIHETVSSSTFDTPENRYFKALVNETYRNVRKLVNLDTSDDEDADHVSERAFFSSIQPSLIHMGRKLESILRSPFLSQVADANIIKPDSMVFHKHPLYARFDRLCRILNGGLSFSRDVIPIGVKETPLLYEYWCFLKIVALLKERFELEEQTVVVFNRLRATVALSKGRSSAIRFTHKPSGKPLYVIYNRLFKRLPTVAQKPDNVIQFATDNECYIFDAKYRFQFDEEYTALYGGPGPSTEDINTMHRYRDAIVIPHPIKPSEYIKGIVSGAVVLFPYPYESEYRSHRFYKSIQQVEIGGLPFLPGSVSLVREKLDALLRVEYPGGINYDI